MPDHGPGEGLSGLRVADRPGDHVDDEQHPSSGVYPSAHVRMDDGASCIQPFEPGPKLRGWMRPQPQLERRTLLLLLANADLALKENLGSSRKYVRGARHA